MNYDAKLPDSAGGHALIVRELRVQEILDIEAAAASQAKLGQGAAPFVAMQGRLHAAFLVAVDGVECKTPAEQEAAVHRMGNKARRFLGELYDKLHEITADESAAFLQGVKPSGNGVAPSKT